VVDPLLRTRPAFRTLQVGAPEARYACGAMRAGRGRLRDARLLRLAGEDSAGSRNFRAVRSGASARDQQADAERAHDRSRQPVNPFAERWPAAQPLPDAAGEDAERQIDDEAKK
jgi:hypothetical protein